MARREYRPYPTRKEGTNRSLKQIILLLIIIIVGGIILIKTYNRKEEAAVLPAAEDQKVALEDITPVKQAPALPNAAKPRVTSTPDPTVAQVIATNPNAKEVLKPQTTTAVPAAPTATQPQPAAQPTVAAPMVKDTATAMPQPPAAAQTGNSLAGNTGSVSTEVRVAIEKAIQLRDQGKIAASRDLLNSVLDEPMTAELRAKVKEQMAKLAETWLYSKEVMADDTLCTYYTVQPGDKLSIIARKFKVPYELLMDMNGIQRAELLQAGQRLKVPEGPFNAVVYKSSFTLDLYLQRTYVKTYRVGLGKVEHDTPTGRWRVASGGKMVKPTWTDPDTGKVYVGNSPDYPLGSRWIALDGIDGAAKGRTGFAIHGTKEPETIGSRSSRGCIRLYNGDVIEVYDRLVEGISEVLVKD